jgi:hypothetical protein
VPQPTPEPDPLARRHTANRPDGRWELEDLGGNRTRATYSLEVDLGRMLSLVIRGPLVDLVRGMLVSARAGELKRAIESG